MALMEVPEEVFYMEEDEDSEEDKAILKQLNEEELKKGSFYMSPILRYKELPKIRDLVMHHDRDWLAVVDGDEGSGKSVLAMQLCKELDPNFSLNNIVWTADDFTNKIKKCRKGTAILLDEGYASANARASLSEANRSLVALATEMRQRNLYVVICIPSIFDLDRYFAIHRSRALFHTFFNDKGERGQFIIFPKTAKKLLYLNGKRTYSYASPSSPFPVMRFVGHYAVDEEQYRYAKAQAFKKRAVSFRAKQWLEQRDSYMKELFLRFTLPQEEIAKIPLKYGARSVSQQTISRVLTGKSGF